MSISYPIRPASIDELPEFMAVVDHAFNSTWPADEVLANERRFFEPERSLVALDGDQIVGTTVAYSFQLTIPGGTAATAGVSGVGVLPTHRRRGILSALMRQQLTDVSEGGEPLAALFASEAGIYRRYGYGVASEQLSFSILAGQASLMPTADPAARADPADRAGAGRASPLSVRLTEPQAAVKDLMAVYEAIRPGRPGMLVRSDNWWESQLSDPAFMREGYSRQRCVVAADATGARGYALYTTKPEWDADGIPAHTIVVRELFATDPAACAALWHNLLSRDLVGEVQIRMRPLDDPLLHLLASRRDARPRVSDGLWIRLIDLPAALTGRRYACGVDVVIEVADALLPANAGRWRLRAGDPADASAPTCERVSAAPDIRLGIAELGSAYLGGIRLGALAAAGLVSEERHGALSSLSTAMSADPLPWAPLMF
jgi:predicted acetyltransferase